MLTALWNNKVKYCIKNELLKVSYMVMQDVNYQLFCEPVDKEVHLGIYKENEKDVSTVFIVAHNLELICQCCTYVLYLEQGTVK